MIVNFAEAYTIDETIGFSDIMALEVAIRNYTNNDFKNPKTETKVLKNDNNRLTLANDYFLANDTLMFEDGEIYNVQESGFVEVYDPITFEIGTEVQVLLTTEKPRSVNYKDRIVFRVDYPPDVVGGAKKLLKSAKKAEEKQGIKSESIGRMSVTYGDLSQSYSPEELEFLTPYRRFNWF